MTGAEGRATAGTQPCRRARAPATAGSLQTATGLVVGLGNPLLSDDGVGPAVARAVGALLDRHGVDVREMAVGGIELMEALVGYEWAIVIDAVVAPGGRPGRCRRIDLARVTASLPTACSHEIGLLEGLEIGHRLGLVMPERLSLFAVEVTDTLTFSPRLTSRVAAAVPRIAIGIARYVRRRYDVPRRPRGAGGAGPGCRPHRGNEEQAPWPRS